MNDLIAISAGPLVKLAAADRLDGLLDYSHVFIPDEVYFEAVEKTAWANKNPIDPDKNRLKEWIAEQQKNNRVTIAKTYVGSCTINDRKAGILTPYNYPDRLGDEAASSFLIEEYRLRYIDSPPPFKPIFVLTEGEFADEMSGTSEFELTSYERPPYGSGRSCPETMKFQPGNIFKPVSYENIVASTPPQ